MARKTARPDSARLLLLLRHPGCRSVAQMVYQMIPLRAQLELVFVIILALVAIRRYFQGVWRRKPSREQPMLGVLCDAAIAFPVIFIVGDIAAVFLTGTSVWESQNGVVYTIAASIMYGLGLCIRDQYRVSLELVEEAERLKIAHRRARNPSCHQDHSRQTPESRNRRLPAAELLDRQGMLITQIDVRRCPSNANGTP